MDEFFVTSESPARDETGNIEAGLFVQEKSKIALHKRLTLPRNVFHKKGLTMDPSSRQRIKQNQRSRLGHIIRLNREAILKATMHHQRYAFNGTTLKGLGKFDDSCDYGISEAGDQAMIEIEVDRLIEAATTEAPFLFSSENLLSEGEGSYSFIDVHNVIDQIICNWEVIKHDNAGLMLRHCPSEMDKSHPDFISSRARIKARYMQNGDDVEGCQPVTLEPPERNSKLYFALVDYITGNIARMLVREAVSRYWEDTTVSTLAQWSAKLKNLSYDPIHYAELCLSNGEDTMQQVLASNEFKSAYILKLRIGGDENTKKEVDSFGDDFDTKSSYYFQKRTFRFFLGYIFMNATRSLSQAHGTITRPSCFESCTLVYRTAFDEQPTMLSNDRDGDIAASSDPAIVSFCYAAMGLLLKNVGAMSSSTGPVQSAKETAIAEWHWSDGNSEKALKNKVLKVTTMDQIISFMVPLGLTTTAVANVVDDMVHFASVNVEEEDEIALFELPPRKFEAMFKIATSDFLERQTQQEGNHIDVDTQPVSNGPMRHGVRVGSSLGQLLSHDTPEHGKVNTRNPRSYRNLPAQDGKTKRIMESWVVSEETIIITCSRYVVLIVTISIMVAVGGMCVPFIVKQKISGVDPFQITTFAWVVAGFISVLGKSLYVADWPWHDFIRGRVVCHSVKDVHDVTGVDCQTIIWSLLRAEYNTILWTKGPYNGMFMRKREGGSSGFAIDEPVRLSTMLASGFVVLKVLNEKGEHLICMDLREGTVGQSYSRLEKGKFLACMDIGKDAANYLDDITVDGDGTSPEESDKGTGEASEKVLKLVVKEFRWNKMLGLYTQDSKFG